MTEENTQEENNEETTFTMNDLVSCKRIIELCSERGTFRADELSTVGKLYDRLNSFIDLQIKQQEQNNP